MNIFNEVVKGATRQFGREFGRAGANAILKGKNAYYVKSEADYSGRIKPSDSDIIRAIKEITKIKFVTTNKANVSRLIEMINLMLPVIKFNGVETLEEIDDIQMLITNYNTKLEYGEVLIDDDFKDKAVDFFNDKVKELNNTVDIFENEMKDFILQQLDVAVKNKKSKKTATILSLIFGFLGFQWFYLKETSTGFYSVLFCWTLLPLVFGLIYFLIFLFMKEESFDVKYNPEYVYYNHLSNSL